MKTAILTNITSPILDHTPYTGEIALTAAYFMPKWYRPQTKKLISWEMRDTNIVNYIPIENGRTYTFQDIVNLLKNHLTEAYQFFIFNNDRVTLKFKKDMGIGKVMFCGELLNKYKLPILQNYAIGEAIQGDEIIEKDLNLTFNDTQLVFFQCKQLDVMKNRININGSETLAIIPLNSAQIIDNHTYIAHEFRNILFKPLDTMKTNYQLMFSATDEIGNILPFYQHAFTILNK